MGRAYKNFWSLNIDEAIVAGILRENNAKNTDVFMPLNAQMKDIDLILMNLETKKCRTIQVKGSRAFEPQKQETDKFGDGSAGWFFFPKNIITKSTADFFIFLIYVLEQSSKIGRRLVKPHIIVIQTKKLKKLAGNNKKTRGGNRYSFKFWINPKTQEAFDFEDKRYDVSQYLDQRGILELNKNI